MFVVTGGQPIKYLTGKMFTSVTAQFVGIAWGE
jgi:hypothetical protein